jgi:hypothetical protein
MFLNWQGSLRWMYRQLGWYQRPRQQAYWMWACVKNELTYSAVFSTLAPIATDAHTDGRSAERCRSLSEK